MVLDRVELHLCHPKFGMKNKRPEQRQGLLMSTTSRDPPLYMHSEAMRLWQWVACKLKKPPTVGRRTLTLFIHF